MNPRRTAPKTMAMIVIQRIRRSPISMARLSGARNSIVSPCGPNTNRNMFWRRKLTAKVATSIVAAVALRSGRNTNSISNDDAMTTTKAANTRSRIGQPLVSTRV